LSTTMTHPYCNCDDTDVDTTYCMCCITVGNSPSLECMRKRKKEENFGRIVRRNGYHEGMHKRAFGKTKDKWEKFAGDVTMYVRSVSYGTYVLTDDNQDSQDHRNLLLS